jgi:hypothetical protein
MVIKRALLIGSQVGGLAGVHNDIKAISARLRTRGFELDVRIEDTASRGGILAGLKRLIRDSNPGDAALIYYSGHGARVHNPRHRPGSGNGPQLLHCLVPTDWFDGGFRGLLDFELAIALAELTDKTQNTAVILDCCHSARMWRGFGSEAVPRTLDRLQVPGVGERLDELRELDGFARLHAESNPHAVRLVAAEADRSAYELPLGFGGKQQRMGIMTAMLCAVLDELGDARVSWRTLAMLVRERVMQHYDYQRPDLEGPGQRYVFELETAELGGGVTYFLDGGKTPALRTSRLLGAELGARYAIMATGQSEYDEAKTIAEAEIVRLEGARAHVRLESRSGAAQPGVGALAFPMQSPLGKRLVRLRGAGVGVDEMRAVIGESRFVAVAVDDAAAFLELEVGEQLRLFADTGSPLFEPEQNTPAARQRMLAQVERCARAESLRDLGDGGLEAPFNLEWGRVVDDERVAMTAGDVICVDDLIYVEFTNRSKQPLYLAVFNVAIDASIDLLSDSGPSGVKIEPEQSYALGLERGNGLIMAWADGVPDTVPLPESLIVIASAAPQDFTVLVTNDAIGKALGECSDLELLFNQIGTGGSRNVRRQRASGESGAYRVERIDFRMSPQRRVPFCMEQPTSRFLLEQSLVGGPQPQPARELVIRLNELVVHGNRALWGSADIRIDTLCVTGGAPETRTYVFNRIADGDRLPFDNLRIFQGRATGFVDFAIWVSRHEDGRPQLPELMREVANDAEFQQATTALAGLVVAGPQAASLAVGLAAGATITYFVNRVIQRALGRHIGLYRCSFLPQEEWGVGRHPASGSMRAQDFSFCYEILGE